ncbi:MAG: hypothetical protein WEB58_00365 [Planctomycetaceae bacterium]
MTHLPIIEHVVANPPPALCRQAEQLAESLLREQPELELPDEFRELIPRELAGVPTLHIDDLSEIKRFDTGGTVCFYQDRARLRAGDGDFVVSCEETTEGYEDYCRDFLNLGSPQWIRPKKPHNPLHIAEACWEDDGVRQFLLDEVRQGRLQSIHPHMGTLPVWELAHLLSREAGRPLSVIAPPPAVSKWANDKIAFSLAASRLFGEDAVPRTRAAWNLAMVSKYVQEMSADVSRIGLKLPNSVGGAGNIILDAAKYRGRTLHAIHDMLAQEFAAHNWDDSCQILIDQWETEVLCSPSCQMWIPPEIEGPPIAEGVFVQDIAGDRGTFVGNVVAQLSDGVTQEIVDRSWILARLLQRLGYVGRCSFDLILVGDTVDRGRLELIECNGRWGGSSLPMTLMNRLFGDWMRQPFATHDCFHDGLERFSFQDLVTGWKDVLFDRRTGRGDLIIMTPGKIRYQSGVSVIALANTWDEAMHIANEDVPARLREFVKTTPAAAT